MNSLEDKKYINATVVKVNWERVNLYIDVKINFNTENYKDCKFDFYAVNDTYKAKAKFNVENLENGIYRLHVNVTNPGYNRCIPIGIYKIIVVFEKNIMATCESGVEVIKKMNDFSRIFIYNKRKKSYNVVFYASSNEDNDLPFIMEVMATELSAKSKEEAYYKKSKYVQIIKKLMQVYYNIKSRKTKPTDKNITFMSLLNETISTNQKAVYDKMIERGMDKEWNISFYFYSPNR